MVKGRSKELKMCNLEKTAAFEYFVSKLVGLDLKKSPSVKELDVEKLNNKLSEYSMTRYMKLLYFFCLTDAKREIYNIGGEPNYQKKLITMVACSKSLTISRHISMDLWRLISTKIVSIRGCFLSSPLRMEG